LEDPNHKIPVPVKSGFSGRRITREQVEALIDYIVNDNMSIECASKKANMSERSGEKYYHLYLNDPNRQITVPRENPGGFCQPCSQEQVTELIHSIVNDRMSLVAASIKANMAVTTAKKYYDKYMDDPNQEVPMPHLKNDAKRLTQNQLSELMGYLVDDKMSLSAASKKAKVSLHTTRRYYNRYLQDPTHRIPSEKSNFGRRYTKPQIKKLIGYIIDDKMSIYNASLKAGMSEPTAKKYYTEYLNGATGAKKENQGS
jgi:transposase